MKCKEGDSHSEGALQACVQDHVLPASAVVDGAVLSVTLQKQVKWSKLLLHITPVVCVCVYLREARALICA